MGEPVAELPVEATEPVVEIAEEKVIVAAPEPVKVEAEVPVEEPVKAVDEVLVANQTVAEVAQEKVPITVKAEAEVPVAESEPVKAVDDVLVAATEPVVEAVKEGQVPVAAVEALKAESTAEP